MLNLYTYFSISPFQHYPFIPFEVGSNAWNLMNVRSRKISKVMSGCSIEGPGTNITIGFGHLLDARTLVGQEAGLVEDGLKLGLGPDPLPFPDDRILIDSENIVENDDE